MSFDQEKPGIEEQELSEERREELTDAVEAALKEFEPYTKKRFVKRQIANRIHGGYIGPGPVLTKIDGALQEAADAGIDVEAFRERLSEMKAKNSEILESLPRIDQSPPPGGASIRHY